MAVPELPKYAPPLGLPPGSVRAVLALVLCGSLWYEVLRGLPVDAILVESALLVVAFYFGVRSTAPPSAPVVPTAVPVKHPLHLPRGTVRGILLFGFFVVIGYLVLKGRPLDAPFVLILQVLTSYLAGFAISSIIERRRRLGAKPSLAVAVFRNVNAVGAVALTVYICGILLSAWGPLFPQTAQYTGNAVAWVVAYYFGSRVSP